jgi:hypothetical protein
MRCIVRTKLPLDALRRSGTTLSLRTQLVPNPLSLMCFRKDQLIRIKNITTLEMCVSFGHIAASCCAKRSLSSVRSGPTRRSRRALAQAKLGPRAAPSGLYLRSSQDRRNAPGVRLLRPNRGLVPRLADFLFGQIRTDTALQACVYSGQIVAFVSRLADFLFGQIRTGAALQACVYSGRIVAFVSRLADFLFGHADK